MNGRPERKDAAVGGEAGDKPVLTGHGRGINRQARTKFG